MAMVYQNNGLVTDDVTWLWKVKLLTPIGLRLERNIWILENSWIC